MAIDYAAALGQVRLLITDVDESALLLTDGQVAAYLTIEGDVVKLAAAQALESIATNEALVQKRIRLLELSTDGPAVAAELRKHAATLRAQAAAEVAVGTDEIAGAFDWAEMVVNDASAQERVLAQAMRGEL